MTGAYWDFTCCILWERKNTRRCSDQCLYQCKKRKTQ